MAKLIVGTVVELHSGGPLMTVVKDRVEQGSRFTQVAWFAGTELKQEILPKDALKVKAEPAPKDGSDTKTE